MISTKNLFLGLDIGSTTAKAVLIDADKKIIDYLVTATEATPKDNANKIKDQLIFKYKLNNPVIVTTGYGRSLIKDTSKTITEITCHAKGVKHLHPDVRTILDIGGQDAKAIKLDNCGGVEDFAMNDRCAAGTGSFLDLVANKFSLKINQLSEFCQHSVIPENPELKLEISSTCVVFAESEIISLIAKGIPPSEVIKAVHKAIAKRVAILLKQVKPMEKVYFSGGVAKNKSLATAIEEEIGLSITTCQHPQIMGALGAALIAYEEYNKHKTN